MKKNALLAALALCMLSQPITAYTPFEPNNCSTVVNETLEEKIAATINGYFTARLTRQYDLFRGLLAEDARIEVHVNHGGPIEVTGREAIIQAYKAHSARVTEITPVDFEANLDPNFPLNPTFHYQLIVTVNEGEENIDILIEGEEEHRLNVTENGVVEIREIVIYENVSPA